MSKNNVREIELPGNKTVSVTEVEFDAIHENWDEYKLSDGTQLRVKNVMLRIFLQTDDEGNIVYNENGEPNAVVVGNQVVVATPGQK